MLANLIGLRWIVTTGLMFAACSTWAATTSYFIYDESGHVIGEYDANGNPIQEHVYLGDRPVAVAQGGSSSGGTVDYVTTDQLNTPRAITDSSQAVIWSWNSDPFGNGNPTGSLTYNLRLPGQYFDFETGNDYNNMRDYDSTIGRYIETDPIGLRGGLNVYAYAKNDPLDTIDIYGLTPAPSAGSTGAPASATINKPCPGNDCRDLLDIHTKFSGPCPQSCLKEDGFIRISTCTPYFDYRTARCICVATIGARG